jgi:hypothetical protein
MLSHCPLAQIHLPGQKTPANPNRIHEFSSRHAPPVHPVGHKTTCLSLLFPKLGLPHLVAPQYDIEHPLHRAKQLLIRRRASPLKVRDDRGCSVALGGEILLRHGGALVVLGLAARLADGLADGDTDGLGLDDFVGAVDFGEALAFGVGGALRLG